MYILLSLAPGSAKWIMGVTFPPETTSKVSTAGKITLYISLCCILHVTDLKSWSKVAAYDLPKC